MLRLVLLVALVALAGCATETPATDQPVSTTSTPEAPAPANGAPDIRQVNAPGLLEDLVALDADLVIVNVWATWCGPCRVEFPEFVRFGRENAGNGIAVRFLSVDDQGAIPQMVAFLRNNGVDNRTYLSDTGSNIVATLAAPRRWSYGIPATFIFNREGDVVDFWEGAVTYDFLQAKVQQHLSTPTDQTASR